MRKLEAYFLGWREKEFIKLLEKNGFYYSKENGQIEAKKEDGCIDSDIDILGRITEESNGNYSGSLIIYTEFEKRTKTQIHPPAKEAFSKLRKLAEEF